MGDPKDTQWPPLDVNDIKPKRGEGVQTKVAPLKHTSIADALRKLKKE